MLPNLADTAWSLLVRTATFSPQCIRSARVDCEREVPGDGLHGSQTAVERGHAGGPISEKRVCVKVSR